MTLLKITIQNWSDKFTESAFALLKQYKETSLYLSTHLFSGDVKCLVCGDKVVGIFVLNSAGKLLLQTDRKMDYSNLIIDALLPEISRFTGLIGDWELTSQFWNALKLRFSTFQEKICKKNILYKHDLENLNDLTNNNRVRFLNAHDYVVWDKLNLAFREEINSIFSYNNLQRQERYLQEVSNNQWWGLFLDQQLVAICAYTARYEDYAQIGCVYTLPEVRGRGFAKQLIYQLMLDSKNKHNVDKLILFTHDDNITAQKVYESLGFKPIGYFGLIVGAL